MAPTFSGFRLAFGVWCGGLRGRGVRSWRCAVSKGSRAREAIPASVDSFAWLALYLDTTAAPAPTPDPGYDAAAVHELLGLTP